MPQSQSPDLTPDERLKQVAAILAQGVLRCHRRISASESHREKPSKSSPRDLEVSGKPRLSVSRRVGG
jgi:hypothetical protein